jgi:hypothetical protein
MSVSSLNETLANLESKLQEIELKALEDRKQREDNRDIQSTEDIIKIPEEPDSQKTDEEVIPSIDIYSEQIRSQR